MNPVWYSLLIGLTAWIFAILAMAKRSTGWMFASFSLCAIAAVLPSYETQHRLDFGDVGGAMDTIGGIIFGQTVLIAVTILLNAIALRRIRKSQ